MLSISAIRMTSGLCGRSLSILIQSPAIAVRLPFPQVVQLPLAFLLMLNHKGVKMIVVTSTRAIPTVGNAGSFAVVADAHFLWPVASFNFDYHSISPIKNPHATG
jgi:hypothetical protein